MGRGSCTPIDLIFHKGNNNETYNVGGHNEWKNIDLVHLLCDIMDKKLGNVIGIKKTNHLY